MVNGQWIENPIFVICCVSGAQPSQTLYEILDSDIYVGIEGTVWCGICVYFPYAKTGQQKCVCMLHERA